MLSKTHTKYIQSLLHKKFRDESGLFIAEGPKVVMDLINSKKFICKDIFALADWVKQHSKILATLSGVNIIEVQDFELKKISSLIASHSVVAIFEKSSQRFKITTSNKITLVLDTIQDPGNFGTIIRIADWFGITNIICSIGCADMYNTKVVQCTMGSLGRVNVIYTDLIDWLKDNNNVPILSASLQGYDIKSMGKLQEAILIIGNEANGVSDGVMNLASKKITIPRLGGAESLNAAVATGIILSHIK